MQFHTTQMSNLVDSLLETDDKTAGINQIHENGNFNLKK